MDIARFRDFCLAFPHAEESLPFDENALVFKVMGKIFAITDIEKWDMVIVKCDPAEAVELRETYDFVQPGYHMSKKHWNSIMIVPELPDPLLRKWVQDSYDLVVASLPAKTRRLMQQGNE
ncbi:MAG: MmcQ/YjbR family DNA-binding protein [Candidatus Cyclonatronum sp.]|uniref:MmcQ/YjbR family DNA-binding protein n=1 Tax=Cyclonatronum sp. TaxID=3024185 RepID=UPI0025BACAC0|nr:MmcQ/YjbR family DNA-binding protein [Cyclonatronum sp.]MCC5933880.1 MmcQ/YjbR family DNA-binding protein [Balneolales bacterium]MCH8487221.1 MmcQ/YjbR family DNA-binding protein [Cyclonatronum sp.]